MDSSGATIRNLAQRVEESRMTSSQPFISLIVKYWVSWISLTQRYHLIHGGILYTFFSKTDDGKKCFFNSILWNY